MKGPKKFGNLLNTEGNEQGRQGKEKVRDGRTDGINERN